MRTRDKPRLNDFEDLSALSDPALHALLHSGDGRERVWAAWEIGLRAGKESVPALSTSGQPDPGVRSHLVVVLAGLGQTRALRTLAVDDEDPGVRAIACEYLCRVTPPEELADTAELLEERLPVEQSDLPVVRILGWWPDAWPAITAGAREALLSHAATRVRAALLDHLSRLPRRGLGDRETVLEFLSEEPDAEVLITMATFVGPQASADTLVRRARDDAVLAPAILQFMADHGLSLSWAAIRPHLQAQDPIRVHRALQLADHSACLESDEYVVRLAEILEGWEYRMSEGAFALSDREQERRWAHYAAREIAEDRVHEILASERPLPQEFGPVLDAMLRRVEEDLHYYLEEDIGYMEGEGVDIRAVLAALNERRRLLLSAKKRVRTNSP